MFVLSFASDSNVNKLKEKKVVVKRPAGGLTLHGSVDRSVVVFAFHLDFNSFSVNSLNQHVDSRY